MALSSALQHVSDATHGLDQLGIAGLILDLLTQVAHVHLDDVGFAHEVIAPDAVQDRLAVEHLAWVREEEVKQVVLGGGELDQSLAATHLPGRLVEGEVGDAQHAPPRTASGNEALLATEQRADARDELLKAEGLGKIV